jgi:hypothetical protein
MDDKYASILVEVGNIRDSASKERIQSERELKKCLSTIDKRDETIMHLKEKIIRYELFKKTKEA